MDGNFEYAFPYIINGVNLWLTCLVFMIPLKWRNKYMVRLVLTEVGVIVMTIFMLRIVNRIWPGHRLVWIEVYMITSYFCSVLAIMICMEVKGFEAWYCGIWIGVTYMFTQELSRIAIYMLPDSISKRTKDVIWLLIFAACIIAVGFTIARWMPEKRHYVVGPRQMISAWVLGFMFNTLCMFISNGEGNVIINLMMQFYCITLLYLQNVLFKKSSISKELDTIQMLWHQQKEQYQISKETIEIINHKCHDLKHQVRAMSTMKDSSGKEKYLTEIENSVQIYNAIIHTGNDILDVILTEKSLLCENSGIHINCVADGKLLSFMDSVDLYALFGNAIDNAIEAVRDLEQKDARLIDLMIYEKQNFLIVQVVNPILNQIEFEDGLPKTTKVKNGYHGYGIKSMRHTIQRYGGYLTAEVKNGCFYLKMMAPLQKTAE